MQLNGVEPDPDQIKALALTNYGHFTSMLVERGEVRGLSLHMQRLARDCRQLFDVELDTERVRGYVRHALGSDARRTVVRVTVYDPALGLGNIGADADPHILVTTRPAPDAASPPLRLQAASYRREMPSVKHIGLFGALKHRRDAQREGYDDVLFVNPDGTISEIATSNIGFIRDGQVVWPRSEWLAGTTMNLINRALDEPVATEPLTLSHLGGMEAAFATNAATGVRPVAAVDSTEWPTTHKILDELRELYADIPGETV
ncbi:branched-subunit amino acid aminotransferase/4-amino-4-deoxychorismate lyase [Saccharomonospora amisosensis]|uniref:Branched-chain amino acid aminotransferase/4-amino-4-deoxychorismate lyase n=3 Tax=Saccharomonospora TaxID=1851 RepID=H5X520_9PSEU|nr:aminotransferase class IV family protein [Saccharomonospora amisosensis]EHR53352.1 branched-chain amino acid aminotransferase/4-amino-4-deoxychorismate lyase [Saccharomonospora marina XMU15]NIJ09900.1 branched-subunit amino acid aminotransferase/4-amino-4-deoxychorismate lyase [Saccharomonospora amisosensis]